MDYPLLVAPRSMLGVVSFNLLMFFGGAILITWGFFLEGQRHMVYDIYANTFPLALFLFILVAITAGVLCIDMSFYRGALVANSCQVMTIGLSITLICTLELSAFLSGTVMKNEVERRTRDNLFIELRLYNPKLNASSTWIDRLQQWLRCCGIDSSLDWKTRMPAGDVPDSCCIQPDYHCGVGQMSNDSVTFSDGCMATFDQWMSEDIYIFSLSALCLCILQTIGIVLLCCLQRRSSDKRSISPA